MMDFASAVGSALSNFRDFKGRAARSEFWWTMLFFFGAAIVSSFLDGAVNFMIFNGIEPFGVLYFTAFLVLFPSMAVRRLHDMNRSGFWALPVIPYFAVLPIETAIGSSFLDIWPTGIYATLMTGVAFCTVAFAIAACWPGTYGPNRFGADPLMPYDSRRRAQFGGF